MTARLLTLVIGVAYRLARRSGGRVWWVVVALAVIARLIETDQPSELRGPFRVRTGRSVNVTVTEPPPA
jgi:hypothetical protein